MKSGLSGAVLSVLVSLVSLWSFRGDSVGFDAANSSESRSAPVAPPASIPPQPASIASRDLGDEGAISSPHVKSLPALVMPARRAAVRLPVGGVISRLTVDVGQSVEAGALLVALDNSEFEANVSEQLERFETSEELLAQAEADGELAQRQHEIEANLYSKQVISQSQWLASGYRVKSAVARNNALKHQVEQERHRLNSLRERRRLFQVTAPLAGTIVQSLGLVDQYARQGDVAYWIESREMQLKVQVPASLSMQTSGIRFSLFARGKWHPLDIVRWDSRFNADGSRTAWLDLPTEAELLAGQFVQLHLETKTDR